MSKVEEKGRANLKYSRFDQYDTAVLETILQADFDAPEAEQMEVEQALYIASLLAERKGIAHKDVAVAKQEFDKYYYPLAKQGDVLYNIKLKQKLLGCPMVLAFVSLLIKMVSI